MPASQRGAQAQLEWRDFGQGAANRRETAALVIRFGLTSYVMDMASLHR